jgi:hypothetical protein
MITVWKTFVKEKFASTRFSVSFNGKTRPVYRDGSKHLIVLDEYHGALELIAFQSSPGPAKHVGSQPILVEFTPLDPLKKTAAKVTKVSLGPASSRGQHKFTLMGQL